MSWCKLLNYNYSFFIAESIFKVAFKKEDSFSENEIKERLLIRIINNKQRLIWYYATAFNSLLSISVIKSFLETDKRSNSKAFWNRYLSRSYRTICRRFYFWEARTVAFTFALNCATSVFYGMYKQYPWRVIWYMLMSLHESVYFISSYCVDYVAVSGWNPRFIIQNNSKFA